jgi:hypothetical protein
MPDLETPVAPATLGRMLLAKLDQESTAAMDTAAPDKSA